MGNWRRNLTKNAARFDDAASDPSLRPFAIPIAVRQAAERLEQWARSTPNWSVKDGSAGGDAVEFHLTRHTRVFRFVDDIHVRISSTDAGARIDAESRSRFGVGDLGQNPRNLRELRRVFQETPS